MRPRKIVLLLQDDERERALLRYVLQVAGYHALAAGDAESAMALCRSHVVDAMVITVSPRRLVEWMATLREAQQRNPDLRTLILHNVRLTARLQRMVDSPQRLLSLPVTARELRETVRTMVARKRGPKCQREAAAEKSFLMRPGKK